MLPRGEREGGDGGEGGGTGPRGSPEFGPPTSQGVRGWDGVRQNAPDGAGSACITGDEGPPSSPSGFGCDGARGREGRSGVLRPLPRDQGDRRKRGSPTGIWGWGRGGLLLSAEVPVAVGFCEGSLEERGRSCLPPRRRRQRRRRGWISSVTPTQPSCAALPRAEGSRPPVTRPSPPRPGPGWARPTP